MDAMHTGAEHIGIEIIDERYRTAATYDGNFANVINHYDHWGDVESYPLLSAIDPFGNAFFNDLQTPKLIQELQKVSDDSTDEVLKNEISQVIPFLNQVKGLVYAHFIGD